MKHVYISLPLYIMSVKIIGWMFVYVCVTKEEEMNQPLVAERCMIVLRMHTR